MTGREFVDLMSDHICRTVRQEIRPTEHISPKSLRLMAALRTQERVQCLPIVNHQRTIIHKRVRAAVCGKLEQEYGSPTLQ